MYLYTLCLGTLYTYNRYYICVLVLLVFKCIYCLFRAENEINIPKIP